MVKPVRLRNTPTLSSKEVRVPSSAELRGLKVPLTILSQYPHIMTDNQRPAPAVMGSLLTPLNTKGLEDLAQDLADQYLRAAEGFRIPTLTDPPDRRLISAALAASFLFDQMAPFVVVGLSGAMAVIQNDPSGHHLRLESDESQEAEKKAIQRERGFEISKTLDRLGFDPDDPLPLRLEALEELKLIDLNGINSGSIYLGRSLSHLRLTMINLLRSGMGVTPESLIDAKRLNRELVEKLFDRLMGGDCNATRILIYHANTGNSFALSAIRKLLTSLRDADFFNILIHPLIAHSLEERALVERGELLQLYIKLKLLFEDVHEGNFDAACELVQHAEEGSKTAQFFIMAIDVEKLSTFAEKDLNAALALGKLAKYGLRPAVITLKKLDVTQLAEKAKTEPAYTRLLEVLAEEWGNEDAREVLSTCCQK